MLLQKLKNIDFKKRDNFIIQQILKLSTFFFKLRLMHDYSKYILPDSMFKSPIATFQTQYNDSCSASPNYFELKGQAKLESNL